MRSKRWAVAGPALLLALAVAGCRGNGSVSGKVYYKDQPLGGGQVMFVARDGTSRTAAIGPDGSYTLDRVPAGPVTISVETESARRAQARSVPRPPANADVPPEATASAAYGGDKGSKYVKIPEGYADPEKSGLEYTVQKGAQEHDIQLR